jgi:hypothetical protein
VCSFSFANTFTSNIECAHTAAFVLHKRGPLVGKAGLCTWLRHARWCFFSLLLFAAAGLRGWSVCVCLSSDVLSSKTSLLWEVISLLVFISSHLASSSPSHR